MPAESKPIGRMPVVWVLLALTAAVLADHVITTMPARVNIEGRIYDLASIADLSKLRTSINTRLTSPSTADQRRGLDAAGVAGRRLRGTAIVSKIESLGRKADDVNIKREAALALLKIDDPRSRPFFVSHVQASDPYVSLFAAGYLVKRMYKEDADRIIKALITGVGTPDEAKAPAQSLSWSAFLTLQDTAREYGMTLPDNLFVPNPPERVSQLNAWWQVNRLQLIGKLPSSPVPPTTAPASQPESQPTR